MVNNMKRRSFLAGSSALFLAGPAFALSNAQARGLVDKLVGEINAVINSGQSESRMIKKFEDIFGRYADVPGIAQGVLGPPVRSFSGGQRSGYVKAFQGYISRKYGKRFREFIGGEIIVKGSKKVGKFFEVSATTKLKGQAPFGVEFQITDRSGQNRFFNMVIEGISLFHTERDEVRAMWDRSNGNFNSFVKILNKAG